MAIEDVRAMRSVEELANHQQSVRSQIVALDKQYEGQTFPTEAREQYAALTEEFKEAGSLRAEFTDRARVIETLVIDGSSEKGVSDIIRSAPAAKEDIWDLSTANRSSPEGTAREYRNRALRANELARYHAADDRTKAQERVEDLIEGSTSGAFAEHILVTGNPMYRSAWFKHFAGMPLNNAEASILTSQRALSLTGASGGFAVPFTLDPTIIPTSNSVVNPFRSIARVVQITNDEWRGVSSGAVTASYTAEATETTDNAPTLVQPTISTEKAQAFIPFSIEVGMDWPGLEAEMGRLLGEAKDDLEAAKFTAGSGTNEPFGVLTGTTNTVAGAAGQTFTIANLYSLYGALPPRYRPRASWLGSLAVINRIRQFDTAGGANLWETLANDAPSQLLGKSFYELSEMADVATGVKFLVYGDFSRFVIVDRIGLSIDTIPHLFGVNHRPTGQRGLYAMWRNSSKVVDSNAFRALVGTV